MSSMLNMGIVPNYDVLVVGSIMIDLVTYVEKLPNPGETVFGNAFERNFGGKGANQAFMCNRMNPGKVGFIGCLGRDEYGKEFISHIANESCAVSGLSITPGCTGIACITVDGSGANTIAITPGANNLLLPSDVDRLFPQFDSAKVCVVQNEILSVASQRALHLASLAGMITIFNPAPYSAAVWDIAIGCDIICPNEVELSQLANAPTTTEAEVINAANALLQRGIKVVVVTLGSRGACIVTRNSLEMVAAKKVHCVDTVGAGDCFIGVLAHYLSKGLSLSKAVKLAVDCATMSVCKKGAQKSYPLSYDLPVVDTIYKTKSQLRLDIGL